jgi:DNA gyrase inhibitor GyrI
MQPGGSGAIFGIYTRGPGSFVRERGSMKDQDVRLVRLDPMWVASVKATGGNPEREAIARIRAWADAKGLLGDSDRHPIFGFDNPPFGARGGPRGYEAWVRIEDESDADPSVELRRFDGGRYAVARCEVHADPWDVIPQAWERLAEWVRGQGYRLGSHQSLEMHFGAGASEGSFVIDLYCPVAGERPTGRPAR